MKDLKLFSGLIIFIICGIVLCAWCESRSNAKRVARQAVEDRQYQKYKGKYSIYDDSFVSTRYQANEYELLKNGLCRFTDTKGKIYVIEIYKIKEN